MTNASASSIQQGSKPTSTAGTKAGKRSAAKALSELFSHIQQPKIAGKSGILKFKNILEPAKKSQLTAAVEPDNCTGGSAAQKRPQKKKAEINSSTIHVNTHAGQKQAQINSQIHLSTPVFDLRNDLTEYAAEMPLQKNTQPNSSIKLTIDPRSPIHGKLLGNNDSGRIFINDGPKPKKETVTAAKQNNTAVDQLLTESNIASATPKKLARPSIESRPASDNASANSLSNISKAQIASSQTAFVQTSELYQASKTDAPVKISIIKAVAKGNEKVKTSSYEKLNADGNGKSPAGKQTKLTQSHSESVHKMQFGEPVSDAIAASLVKSDFKAAGKQEQLMAGNFSNFSNTAPVNVNSSVNSQSNIANIYEQVASVATAASHKIGQKIAVNLNPPELGRISIKFEKNGNEVTGCVEVEKSQTKQQIDLNVSQIVHNLQDSGVQLKRLDVVMQEQTFETQKEFAGNTQPDWNEKQFTGDQNHSDVYSYKASGNQFSNASSAELYLSEKSVNILI